jgi:hypothetical protein
MVGTHDGDGTPALKADQEGVAPETGESADGKRPFEYGDRPLVGYAVTTGVFFTTVAATALALRRSGRRLPLRVGAGDLVTIGIATHKLSRTIAKDKVTSFVRAPFTRFEKPTGQGEVAEEVRRGGRRETIGELLLCPYCLSQWVAAAFFAGLVAKPELTRLVAGVYTAETVADFLQLAYLAAEEHACR